MSRMIVDIHGDIEGDFEIIAPYIEREKVHGEWEECEIVQERGDEPIIDEWQSARCSVCGKYHTTPYMYYFDHFNYCPNCGADMRERREDGEVL